MHLIGLTGPAGSGKSTVARLLVEQYHCVPVAFADGFKVPAVALDGLAREQVFGPLPKNPVTRNLLQVRGTEQGRDVFGPDVWVRHVDAYLYRLAQMGVARVVIDDVRFPNEADFVHHQAGVVWQLRGRGDPLTPENAAHRSEIPLDLARVDWQIDNVRGLVDLRTIVQSYLNVTLGWMSNAEQESYL